MGRPAWVPTEQNIKDVESYAAVGLTKEQISDCLGISYQTLNEKTKEYSEFADAIKRGQAKGIAMVSEKLLQNINIGNVTAQIFFLKCHAKWNDNVSAEEEGNKLKDELQQVREMIQKCMLEKS